MKAKISKNYGGCELTIKKSHLVQLITKTGGCERIVSQKSQERVCRRKIEDCETKITEERIRGVQETQI